jgi:pimeloyl-ACP methyl ester carboxylesterase
VWRTLNLRSTEKCATDTLCQRATCPCSQPCDGVKRRLAEHVGRDMAFFDSARAAATLSLPVLIFHDPMDQEVPWSHGEAIARAWPGSVLRSPQDVGHFQILKDPGLLSQAVEFVTALTPRTFV